MPVHNIHFDKLVIYFDGASKNNPRRPSAAGGGWTLRVLNDNGADCRYLASGQVYLGYNVSSNRAEYMGLIDALNYIIENNISCNGLYLRSDSAVVIDQLRGTYSVRKHDDDIMDCHDRAVDLIHTVVVDDCQQHVTCTLIGRSKNIEADRLAHYAIYDKCSQTFEH